LCPRSTTACLLGVVLSSSPTAALGQAQGASDRAREASEQAQEASDQAESVDLEAIRIPDNLSIDLDGRLDEEAWSLATPISDFTQQYPVEGGSPSERTEIRVVFNGDELFIGAILYDDPSGILAYQKRRDAGLGTDDRFMWILDTFLDGRTGYFFEIKKFQAEAFFVWNSNPTPSVDTSLGDLTARGFRFDFPNDVWQAHLSYREFGNDYDPAVGFVTRNGFRRVEPRVAWRPLSDVSWIRRFSISAQYRRLANLTTGQVEEEQWDLNLFGFDFEAGDNWDIIARRQDEFLDRAFEISDGVVIQPGQYANWEWTLTGRTASRRRLSANFNFTNGGFWSGDRSQVSLRLTFRPNPGISFSTDIERNDVKLPEGNFTVDLTRFEAAWDINPWASVSGNIQYDTQTEIIGLIARARWSVKPGNDLFLVYTNNWRNLGGSVFDRNLETLSRGGSVKVNYTYRL